MTLVLSGLDGFKSLQTAVGKVPSFAFSSMCSACAVWESPRGCLQTKHAGHGARMLKEVESREMRQGSENHLRKEEKQIMMKGSRTTVAPTDCSARQTLDWLERLISWFGTAPARGRLEEAKRQWSQ